ncbi:MAG: HDIG domain-containing protein [Defluviitaleaceae bacterium]|nr:HDIG domain-containing protein [Defluviitaleaceae bacterium]
MSKAKSKIKLNIFLILISFAFTIYLILTGPFIRGEGFQISVGDVSSRLFTATREVENRVETERRREVAYNSIEQRFARDTEAIERTLDNLDSFFEEMDRLRVIFEPFASPEPIFEVDEEGNEVLLPSPLPPPLNSHLTEVFESGFIRYLALLEEEIFENFENNVRNHMDFVLMGDIRETTVQRTLVEIQSYFNDYYIEVELSRMGYAILAEYLEPNMIYDEELTQSLREEAAENVTPVVLMRGEEIVREGQRITEEAYQILDDLGLIARDGIENYAPVLGAVLLAMLVFGFALYYINRFNKEVGRNNKEVLLLFTLYMVVIISAHFLTNLPFVFIPTLAFVMLVGILIEQRLSLVLNIAITIITFLIVQGEMSFIVYFTITGIVMALISKYANQRNNLILVGLVISAISAVTYASVAALIVRNFTNEIFITMLYAFGFGILTVLICIGSLPLWEALFGIITPIKLLELINPNNPLLKQLAIEAPGTYHHSIIVANLAEAAANDIGADSNIARVGGYFQDIGKLKYPQYFIENQVGQNPHDFLEPHQSSKIIVGHVEHGLKLAEKYKLPKVVKDIIAEHHGNGVTGYFYIKAKEELGEDNVNKDDFRYQQRNPQSREAAIVMLADIAEAAVRSKFSKNRSMEEIDAFVRKLINNHLSSGTLEDSKLMIKDMTVIGDAFMRVFKGMYHERIPYPEEKKKAEVQE